ncbi:MAG: GNAT family N-acetyltransferase [Anaerolineales bacterium]|jgi:amino-acid N-acetyltransferase
MKTIRPANATDSSEIKRLVRSERLNPLGLNWRRFLIAEDRGGGLLGCVQVKKHGGEAMELSSLVVTPVWRGRGVAGALIEYVQQRSNSPLWLTCRSGLIPFYSRFGFREIRDPAQMPRYFKLTRIFGKLLHFVGTIGGYLAVMRWDLPAESRP